MSRQFRLLVPRAAFYNKLDRLTKNVSLELVWPVFYLLKKDHPFIGFVWEDKFDISRGDDIWPYPVRLQGTVNSDLLTINVNFVKTNIGLWILIIFIVIMMSIVTYIQSPREFEIALPVLPIVIILFFKWIISFTKKQLLNQFEYYFRDCLVKLDSETSSE